MGSAGLRAQEEAEVEKRPCRDRREVAQKGSKAGCFMDRRVDRDAGAAVTIQQRIAVGRRAHDRLGGDIGRSAPGRLSMMHRLAEAARRATGR